MIKYGRNAVKEVSRHESNGITTVKEKIEISVNYLGDTITLVGWNGLSRTRTFLSKEQKQFNKSMRHINNKIGTGLSNPTRDTNPTHSSH